MADAGLNTIIELENWASQLVPWQRCLLSMLIGSSDLTSEDYATIVNEFLWDNELAEPPNSRANYSLGAPAALKANDPTPRLRAIKDVVGVNALARNQRLDIGPQLTVIYGPNGSGKSGYARILKASCFTRSKSLGILGDIKVSPQNRPPLSATFEFDVGPDATFDAGNPCLQLASRFAVFDSSCVRVYTDERNVFNVTPYLFDVFPRMVLAIGTLNDKLKELIANNTPNLTQWQIQGGTTEVATLLGSLSLSTDEKRLCELANLAGPDDDTESRLEAQLAELRKTDRATLITQKTRAASDFLQLEDALRELDIGLSNEAITNIKAACDGITALREQSTGLDAVKSGSETPLPIGTSAWRALIEAAVVYNSEAYPGYTLPADVAAVRCVLCQQPLESEAKSRLSQFISIVANALETKLKDSRRQLENLLQSVKALNTNLLSPTSACRRSLEDHFPLLTPKIEALLTSYEQRRALVLSCAACGKWSTFVAPETSPMAVLAEARQSLKLEIETLTQSNPAERLAALTGQLALLRECKSLAGSLPAVRKGLEQLRWATKIGQVMPVSSRFVTERQKALMEQLVAKGFRESFAKNCKRLDIKLPLNFAIAGADGETGRRLSLDTLGGANAKPSQVLSEGEQSAVALADFLTEIALDGSSVGIVLDDPVSSMDHLRKEAIAKLLVEEALKRQVVVFTHDIIFSHHLAAEAGRVATGFEFFGKTVAVKHDGTIGCIDEIAFPHALYEGEALSKARQLLADAKQGAGTAQEQLLQNACSKLRTAYENFVMRKLFADVVGRWRENMKYTLKDVHVPDDIVARVDERLSSLSRYVDAHSHSAEYQEKPITPAFVDSEIAAFVQIDKDFNRAKNDWKEARPKVVFR